VGRVARVADTIAQRRVTAFPTAQRVLETGLSVRAYTAVSAEVGRATGPVWTFAAGGLSTASDAAAATEETIYDLASLTKVLSTTALAMMLCARGAIDIDEPVSAFIPEWIDEDRASVTLRDLLEHCSGLPAHRPFYETYAGRASFQHAIACTPLDHAPRTRSVYSDLGFMLVGFVIEDIGVAPLEWQFNRWRMLAGVRPAIDFHVHDEWRGRIAATENDPWRGRLLQGEVHDENTAALGGVAGHAGLFGTAAAVGDAARWWLRLLGGHDNFPTGVSSQVSIRFVERSTVAGSSRALGWDTMLPTSSCGTRLSARAIGHTGFTGTSLWIDPVLDLYVVLLTNRVHPTRDNQLIQQVRRDFHDAVVDDFESRSRG
jgi:CubicO group peptidase (beta-lactamase class C family)